MVAAADSKYSHLADFKNTTPTTMLTLLQDALNKSFDDLETAEQIVKFAETNKLVLTVTRVSELMDTDNYAMIDLLIKYSVCPSYLFYNPAKVLQLLMEVPSINVNEVCRKFVMQLALDKYNPVKELILFSRPEMKQRLLVGLMDSALMFARFDIALMLWHDYSLFLTPSIAQLVERLIDQFNKAAFLFEFKFFFVVQFKDYFERPHFTRLLRAIITNLDNLFIQNLNPIKAAMHCFKILKLVR